MFAVLGLPNIVVAAIVTAVIAVVFHKRVFGANDPYETSWIDAWLKAIVIMVSISFFVGFVPSWAMQTDLVVEFDRTAQDLVGSALWLVALVATLVGLWYAHRENRV